MLDEDESYLEWRKQAIELHSDDGTHRLELPVSRTTLKVWGGVPREISEKSERSDPMVHFLMAWLKGEMLTLSVQEVVNQDVMASRGLHGSVLEVLVRAVTHVLLAQGLHLGVDVVVVLDTVRVVYLSPRSP